MQGMKDEFRAPDGAERPPRLWSWHSILSGVITLLLFALMAGAVNWAGVWQEILCSEKSYILLGALCHYLTYPVRGLRWLHCLAHLPNKGGKSKFAQVVFFYNFVDNLVPAKLGDLYAAHLARINFGVRRSEAIGSIVFMRMIDTWVILTLALLASSMVLSAQLPDSVRWTLIGGVVMAAASTCIMLFFFFLDRSLPGWIPKRLGELVRAFRKGMWPRVEELLPIMALTLTIWTLEALWVYLLACGFDLHLSASEALFLTMIPVLASAFPLTPSGAGLVELTLFSCLRLVGVAAPLAESITLLNRFIDYWLHIILGLMMWLFRNQLKLCTWREVSGGKVIGPAIMPMELVD